MPATRRLILFIIIILLLLLLFIVVPSVSWSQTLRPNPWQEPARELAKKIVAITGPRQTFALVVRNLSSLSDSEVAAVRAALDAELRAAGLRLAAKPDAPELRITLSENLQGFLWIAEIPREGSRDVAMVSLPKTSISASTAASQMFVLQSKLVYQQDEPILDFALVDVPSGATPSLLVLEPTRLAIYKPQNAIWQLQQYAVITGATTWSRDMRGRLLLNRTTFALYVPGIECTGGAPLTIDLKCGEANDWTLVSTEEVSADAHLTKGRNFFSEPEDAQADQNRKELSKFFTIAVYGPKDENIWLLSLLNGRTALYTDLDSTEPQLQAGFVGWGSEIAAIETDCGRLWQVLASRPTDWTEPDTLQAFEVVERMPVAVSSLVSFHGPITALWTTPQGDAAHAVVHNLKTGRYEAYILTLSCGR